MIEELYTQLNQAVDFADAASTPFTPIHIIAISYKLVFKAGLYNGTCHEWRRPLPDNKTWANFQADFPATAQDLCKSQATTQSTGYHGANAPIEDKNAEEKSSKKRQPLPWPTYQRQRRRIATPWLESLLT